MKHIGGLELYNSAVYSGRIVLAGVVLVVEPSVFISVHGHAIRHKWIEGDDLSFTVANNLGIGISLQHTYKKQKTLYLKGF